MNNTKRDKMVIGTGTGIHCHICGKKNITLYKMGNSPGEYICGECRAIVELLPETILKGIYEKIQRKER